MSEPIPFEIPAPGVLVAVEDPNDVTFDVEPVRHERERTRFFSSNCHDHEGRRKEVGVDTNLHGVPGCFAAGTRKKVRAISVNVLEGALDKPVKAQFLLAGEVFGDPFDLAPGEITPLQIKNAKVYRNSGIGLEAVTVDRNEIVLEGVEWFAVEVWGVESRVKLKLNLHGPLARAALC